MSENDAPNRFDLVVIGAGVFGLSAAVAAVQRGLSVALIEKRETGAGASGGFLGTLMPHFPARWTPVKEFQFQALRSLEPLVRQLEAETGLSAGYARIGRIIPLTTENKRAHALQRVETSKIHWRSDQTGYTYQIHEADEAAGRFGWPDLISAHSAAYGFTFDNVAARIAPKSWLNVMEKWLRARGAHVFHGCEFKSFDERTGDVRLTGKPFTLLADKALLCAGYEGYADIAALTGCDIGAGVKGHAVRFKPEKPALPNLPVLYSDGIYVVSHDDGSLAVGSTSEHEWADVKVDEEAIKSLTRAAKELCPLLHDAQIVEKWAGVRPKCSKRDPIAGLLPGYKKTYVMTGGYKISFGVAHTLANALLSEINGASHTTEMSASSMNDLPPIPDSFRPEWHFAGKAA